MSNKPLESQGSEYRLVLLFENTSSKRCRLNGYPGADIVNETGPAVHVDRRQQIAAPVLMLEPGDVATADLQARDVHPQTGGPVPALGFGDRYRPEHVLRAPSGCRYADVQRADQLGHLSN